MSKKIINCVNKDILSIYRKVVSVEAVQQIVNQYLAKEYQGLVHASSFDKGILQLTVNDNRLATEIRYQLPELRNKLRKEPALYTLSLIKLIVQPLSR